MLRAMKPLTGYKLATADNDAGKCTDFLFDDQAWIVRYVVVNTGSWLNHSKVLVSPSSLNPTHWDDSRFTTSLTNQQIEAAPPLADNAPVSKQYQMIWAGHYGLTPYWSDLGPLSAPLATQALATMQEDADHDEHLRSFNELCGYEVAGVAPERHGDVLGRVEDFVFEVDSWKIRYAVVETDFSWTTSHKVIIAPEWLDKVGWAEQKLYLDLDGKRMKEFPPYDPSQTVYRTYEQAVYEFLGKPMDWIA